MGFKRSFSTQEEAAVRKFMLACLKQRGTLTTEQLYKLVEEAFPQVDYASIVFHLTNDLVREGVIVSKQAYEIR